MPVPVVRLSCRCLAEPVEGGYRVEAEAFLCNVYRHKQGDFISTADERAMRVADGEWDRARREWAKEPW